MYYLQTASVNGTRPVYEYLPGGDGRMFMPEARVAVDYATRGAYESALLAHVYERFFDPAKVCLDIGANVGLYSLAMAQRSKHVHAFECVPQSFNYLCANIALNGNSALITPHRVALSDRNSFVECVIRDPGDGGGNGVEVFGKDTDKPKVRVEARTLDSYHFENVGFIKIDVEGHELSVLRGAVWTLKANNYPPILFESWRSDREDEGVPAIKLREELFSFVQGIGYQLEDAHCGYGENFIATHNPS
jgi:FkbM family methyltransferase